MHWTTEPPRREHIGKWFWMQIGDRKPEVVLIMPWSGKRTAYQTAKGICWIAYHDNPTPMMTEIMSHTKWAGPIPMPEESCTK